MARRVGKTARNEQRKLEANTVNNGGIAVLLGGFLQPFFTTGFSIEALLRLFICGMICLVGHMWAQDLLDGVED